MADQLASSLSSLDFRSLIGGPLCAVVEAQASASMTTLSFLAHPSIVTKDGNIRNVVFRYKKQNPAGGDQMAELQVPILTIVPIPFLRIKETTLQFHAKLEGTFTRDSEEKVSANVSIEDDMNVNLSSGGIRTYGENLNTKATFAHSRTDKTGYKEEREYSMDIKVTAVQDVMPAGLDRVLSLLENCIQERLPEKKK